MSLMQTVAGGFRNAIITWRSATTAVATASATKTISMSIGTEPSADRYVIVYLQHPTSNTARTVNTATINGVSATIAVNLASGAASYGVACFFALVPTGSGSVGITANLTGTTTSATHAYQVWTVTGRTTLTFASSATSGVATSTTGSAVITPPVYGFNLNFYVAANAPTSPTWTSTLGAPTQVNSNGVTSSSVGDFTSANGGEAVTTTFTSANNQSRSVRSTSFSYV